MGNEFEIDFDASEFLSKLDLSNSKSREGAERGLRDCIDELARISSEIAPMDKGILQRSHAEEMKEKSGELVGTVEYSVKEAQSNGKHFNYALWTHEGEYTPGEQTKRRPGTTGWSGKKYEAGRKYLERPVKGEKDAFLEHIADEVRKELKE